jgi:hypothetical protein
MPQFRISRDCLPFAQTFCRFCSGGQDPTSHFPDLVPNNSEKRRVTQRCVGPLPGTEATPGSFRAAAMKLKGSTPSGPRSVFKVQVESSTEFSTTGSLAP